MELDLDTGLDAARARGAPVRPLGALAQRCVPGDQPGDVGAGRRIRRGLLPLLGGHRPVGACGSRRGTAGGRGRREGRAQRGRHPIGRGRRASPRCTTSTTSAIGWSSPPSTWSPPHQRRWRRGSVPAAWAILMRGGRRQLLQPRPHDRAGVCGARHRGSRTCDGALGRRAGRSRVQRPRDRVHRRSTTVSETGCG